MEVGRRSMDEPRNRGGAHSSNEEKGQGREPPSNAPGGGRRLRSMLREYYGLGGEEPQGNTADPTNINGSSFDANAYFENLLKTQGLSQLIETDNKMVQDIRKLDSDMKTLVYENYNKFISATETIRKMKSNVENMEEEMKRLQVNMEKITTCSSQINSTLSERRGKIEQLTSIHRLLKKLQFLVELPSRLKKAIELEAYAQAVRYFNLASGILRRYDNLPSFKSIHHECEQIIQELTVLLKNKLANPKSSASEVTEAIGLLLELHESSAKLLEEYLQYRKKHLEGILDGFVAPENSDLQTILKALNSQFISDFLDCSKSFIHLFIDKESSPAAKKEAMQHLDEFIKDVFGKYYLSIRGFITNTSELSLIIKGLEVIYDDMNDIHSQLPELSMIDRALDIINNVVQSHMETLFNNLQAAVKGYVERAWSEVVSSSSSTAATSTLSALCADTASTIITDIQVLLDKLKLFFIPVEGDFLSKHSTVFLAKIHVKIQQLFLFLNILLTEYDAEFRTKDESKELRFLLVLSRLALQLEDEGVPQMNKILSKLTLLVSNASEYSINEPDLRQRLKTTAETLVSHYMFKQSQKISQMLWKSIDTPNWLKMKEVKSPRSVMNFFISEINTIHDEVADIFNEKNAVLQAASTKALGRRDNNSKNLFEKKIQLHCEIEFGKNAIVTQIIKIVLKAFLEYTRLKTFGKNGYQQMQVDVYFIRTQLTKLVDGTESVINALLDEIMSSSSDRAIEPVPLEQTALYSICDAAVKKNEEAAPK